MLPTSIGHHWQRGGRNAPTVLNAVFNTAQFWDGRAADLKEQAVGPIQNPIEMAISPEHAVEATLLTPNAPFDKYLRGNEGALSGEQKAGLRLFIDKGCAACHNGVNVGGGMYAPFGVVEKPGADILPLADKGRFEVTRTASDEYVFKVPTLRNIALTAPYFHSGKSWDLEQAIGDAEISSIAAFLLSLTGEQPQVVYPILPPSTVDTPRPEA